MTLAEISIRRPVFTIVMSILIVLSGCIGLARLGVREYPSVGSADDFHHHGVPRSRGRSGAGTDSPSPSRKR
jgi:hypothetical protein